MTSQFHLKCDCGFQGAVRSTDGIARCFGCDALWTSEHKKLIEPPKFDSLQEMQSFYMIHKPPNVHVEEVHKSRPSTKGNKTKSLPVGPFEPNKEIYSVVHYYVRPLSTWNDVLKDAKVDRSVRNSNVLIWAHNHSYDVSCDAKCRIV